MLKCMWLFRWLGWAGTEDWFFEWVLVHGFGITVMGYYYIGYYKYGGVGFGEFYGGLGYWWVLGDMKRE